MEFLLLKQYIYSADILHTSYIYNKNVIFIVKTIYFKTWTIYIVYICDKMLFLSFKEFIQHMNLSTTHTSQQMSISTHGHFIYVVHIRKMGFLLLKLVL